jgi:hypothetical protein
LRPWETADDAVDVATTGLILRVDLEIRHEQTQDTSALANCGFIAGQAVALANNYLGARRGWFQRACASYASHPCPFSLF